ncbi:hypothetical protein D3C72_1017850 [compost metagenome]
MAGLTATISVPACATARAQAPIFSVMLQVVLGLMILMRTARSLLRSVFQVLLLRFKST